METVTMELPDEMISFTMQKSKEKQLVRNAMMLYPYIQEGRISHGKAAEILGIFKMDSGEQEMAWCHGAGGIALGIMAEAEAAVYGKIVGLEKEEPELPAQEYHAPAGIGYELLREIYDGLPEILWL